MNLAILSLRASAPWVSSLECPLSRSFDSLVPSMRQPLWAVADTLAAATSVAKHSQYQLKTNQLTQLFIADFPQISGIF
jgi:hypothetical protein